MHGNVDRRKFYRLLKTSESTFKAVVYSVLVRSPLTVAARTHVGCDLSYAAYGFYYAFCTILSTVAGLKSKKQDCSPPTTVYQLGEDSEAYDRTT